ncbi:MAG TPA: hypothetical protein VGM77_10355 [Gemmatimonadales bacterium]|jgi:hypothetical protein
MSDAIAFLHALAQALSTMALYAPGHPAARRATQNLWQAAAALLASDGRPVFLFLGTAPVYNGRALQELRDWHHSGRLAAAGVQRLEFDAALTEASMALLIERLTRRLAGEPVLSGESPIPGIAFGPVVVDETDDPAAAAPSALDLEGQPLLLDFDDELAAMRLVLAEAGAGRFAQSEADALVRVLTGLVERWHLPQVAHTGLIEDLAPTLALNTTLLTIAALATEVSDPVGLHRVGMAALVHNIGSAGVANELVSAAMADGAGASARAGARLLLDQGGRNLELSALVAFEHCARADGTGEPSGVPTQWTTGLVQVAAAFALGRAPRDGQPGASVDAAWNYVVAGAGSVFDPAMVELVSRVVHPA